jgi:hypothetical protein
VTVFQAVRSAAARVAERALHVEIDPDALRTLASSLVAEAKLIASPDPARARFEDPRTTLEFIVALDAVNFGSGWFPVLAKIPGRSGYMTISTRLRAHFARHGAWSVGELAHLEASDCALVFEQDPENLEVGELMTLFARSLSDLGRFLEAHGMRSCEELVDAAAGRAARLVELLTQMPLYRDVSRYADLDVPLYKRAQITAADLALAFGGEGPGRFDDLDLLTMFADNLVPHVMRCEGALRYDPALLARIDRGELLPAGSPEEVEIRAVALHAVEQIVEFSSSGETPGTRLPARTVDQLLWNRGQSPAIKRRNRHRSRSVYY